MSSTTLEKDAYLRWLQYTVDIHRRQAWKLEQDSAELEELQDLWELIPDKLQDRLWGLSADLYSLVDNEKFVDSDWPSISQEQLGELQQLALKDKKWDELLELLRRPPRFLKRDQVACLRARAWEGLGHPEIALLFFDNAVRLDPDNDVYHVLVMNCLEKIGNWEATMQRVAKYRSDPNASAKILFAIGSATFAYAMTATSTAKSQFEQALNDFETGLSRIALPNARQPRENELGLALSQRAICLEILGRLDESLVAFDLAIRYAPEVADLYVGRGLVRQRIKSGSGIADLHRAVQLNSNVVWPYLELAHSSFQRRDFRELDSLCRKGLLVSHDDKIAAVLRGYRAIALYQLHAPIADVENEFKIAIKIDPSNIDIQHNYQLLKDRISVSSVAAEEWQMPEFSTADASRDLCNAIRS